MALLFREVNNVMWWDPFRDTEEAWLGQAELRGDALKSLNSRDCTLSVYVVDDSNDTIERVLAAFAAQRERLSNVDFALVEASELEDAGFVLRTLDGRTPDATVNTWHRDLIQLSASRILDLAARLKIDAAFCRRRKPEVKRIIKKAIDEGRIDTTKMSKDLLDEVIT